MSCNTIRLHLRAALMRAFAAVCLAIIFAPAVFGDGELNEIPYPAPDSGGIGSSGTASGASLPTPGYSSRPGAPYTIYLDFGGFSFTGNWGNNFIYTPGVTPAYDIDGNPSSFSATELANIQNIWSRVAEKYSWANVNVTTIDPAVAAGQAGTDLSRQNFYDNTPQLMHTVIGGNSSWLSPLAGGISWLTKTGHAQPGSNGYHTDFVFSNVTQTSSTNLQFIGEAAAHENGHGFGLNHQSVYNGNTFVTEYNPGTAPVGSPPTPGSKAPIMGVSYYLERGLWKIGTADTSGNGTSLPVTQNDIATILNTGNNPNIAIINDGVGHALASATALPMIGTTIDFSNAKGVITPTSTNPATSGAANYTTDFWSFSTTPSTMSLNLTVNAGRESITPGVPDPGAMLDASLAILDSNGNIVASAATISLSETISMDLPVGNYYAEVLSAADPGNSGYFDVGSYFLTGTLVPEPSTIVLMAVGSLALFQVARRRRLSCSHR